MSKTLMYRLFRIGALPKSMCAGLENEALQYLDEGRRLPAELQRTDYLPVIDHSGFSIYLSMAEASGGQYPPVTP